MYFPLLGSVTARKPIITYLAKLSNTVNPLLSPPGGLIYFKHVWGGGLIERGGLFNLAKRITDSKKRGRNRPELWFPTSCFGPVEGEKLTCKHNTREEAKLYLRLVFTACLPAALKIKNTGSVHMKR